MVSEEYVPDRGHIVWLQFNPQSGHEQRGRRPALVLSPKAYNEKVGLLLACPITSRIKGYPFEVALPSDLKIEGVILSDQIRSLDWRTRRTEYAATAPESTTHEVLNKIGLLLDAW